MHTHFLEAEVECNDCDQFCERPHCDSFDECGCGEYGYVDKYERILDIVQDQPYWCPSKSDAFERIKDVVLFDL